MSSRQDLENELKSMQQYIYNKEREYTRNVALCASDVQYQKQRVDELTVEVIHARRETETYKSKLIESLEKISRLEKKLRDKLSMDVRVVERKMRRGIRGR